jgi:hypothetical protein
LREHSPSAHQFRAVHPLRHPIAVDTVLPVKRWMLILAAPDMAERVGVLCYRQGQGALPCAGLRPSLTTAARAD